jgi:two-component system, chemotaxis family, chemotaxis protein CheY
MATVMIIDDSKTVRNYHKSILQGINLEVIEAENGMEALERSLSGDIGLYLVDVNMPVMDGYSFIKQLRIQPEYKYTPIIMITTQDEESDKIEAYRVGANLFETKPIKSEQLKAYVNLLLRT